MIVRLIPDEDPPPHLSLLSHSITKKKQSWKQNGKRVLMPLIWPKGKRREMEG